MLIRSLLLAGIVAGSCQGIEVSIVGDARSEMLRPAIVDELARLWAVAALNDQNVVTDSTDVVLFMDGAYDAFPNTNSTLRFNQYKAATATLFDSFEAIDDLAVLVTGILPTDSIAADRRIVDDYNPWLVSEAESHGFSYWDEYDTLDTEAWRDVILDDDGVSFTDYAGNVIARKTAKPALTSIVLDRLFTIADTNEFAAGDWTRDGVIDLRDFHGIRGLERSPIVVPEPRGLGLLGCLLVLFARRTLGCRV